MITKTPKRSNEPPFWGLFGAGGMYSAIFFPVLILLIGIILPLSMKSGASISATTSEIALLILVFFSRFFGSTIVLGAIILPLWCAMHRIHHCLHDLKIHLPGAKFLCYGFASIVSLLAIVAWARIVIL